MALAMAGGMRRSLLLLGLLSISCGGEGAIPLNPDCAAGAEVLESCLGETPEEFATECEADPSQVDALVGARCPKDTKADGWFGWVDFGWSCRLNWVCDGDLVCRPTASIMSDRDKLCLERSHELGYDSTYQGYCGGLCDSDGDCASGHECVKRERGAAGMCIREEHESSSVYSCTYQFGGDIPYPY